MADLPIRGILFDSGDTLVYPIGGTWFPGPRFRHIIENAGIAVDWTRLPVGLRTGMRTLNHHHIRRITTESEELALFDRFYARVLLGMGLAQPPRDLPTALAEAHVMEPNIRPFEDTVPTLEFFRRQGIKLVIVSNAWPSLQRKYRELGLAEYFIEIVVSSMVGLHEPDRRIWDRGRDVLGTPREELLVVDDFAGYVVSALRAGYQGVQVRRDGLQERRDLIPMRSLAEVTRYVEEANRL